MSAASVAGWMPAVASVPAASAASGPGGPLRHTSASAARAVRSGGREGRRVVVVGASLAGLRAAEALREGGFAGHLSVVGEEPHEPYDRPPLSKGVLAGATDFDALRLPAWIEPATLDVSWRLGVRAVGLDLGHREVVLDDASRLAFDGLVIATGARPRQLSGALDVQGVHVLRTLDDARWLREALRRRPRSVAVLGGGFIGCEVAATARSLGLDVTLIHAAPLPMLTAVGGQVAGFCADLHRRHGVHLRLGAGVRQVHANRGGELESVELSDGTRVGADVAVMGLGAVPNTEWLTDSGVMIDRGVRTDAALRVLDTAGAVVPGVVAAGDITRWPHWLFDGELVRVEHWSNAIEQGAAAARSLLHHLAHSSAAPLMDNSPLHSDSFRHGSPAREEAIDAPPPFTGLPSFWSDQYDAKILSAGLPALATTSAVLDGDLDSGRFVVGYGRNGQMVGAVAVNYPRRLSSYRGHITARGCWPPPARTAAAAPARTPAQPRSGPSTSAPPSRPAHPSRPDSPRPEEIPMNTAEEPTASGATALPPAAAAPASAGEATEVPTVQAKVIQNGPLQIKGPFQLVDHDGNAYDIAKRRSVLLCRCGASTNKPFCDGTHSRIGFAAAERAVTQAEQTTTAGDPGASRATGASRSTGGNAPGPGTPSTD
ncbi:FAD-dependent oxidoreductase [Kineococcus sp. SYSU DK018]|uniref:FAD-dependent oxidoreductase n=1 Tax=Kineococcus sp. SYSU DK018 TaxID=3383139 RepID=UPI003D7D02B5